MIPEGLESRRLNYRNLTTDDYESLLPFFKSKEATRFYYLDQSPESTGQFAGQCGLLKQIVDETPEPEIGYSLLPDFWSQGFATEAARFFRDFAFQKQMADSIISIIDINNIRSQKVAYNNGMQIDKKTQFKNMQVYIFRITFLQWKR